MIGAPTNLKNQKGQVAIFVALIFQVLFVLFAMVINVGLIVHDKINLQNSVDLAAYYAAQKQAQWLNVIAHENYQIRQAWKLLAFRIRVIGAAGLSQPYKHPAYGSTTLGHDIALPGSLGNNPTVCTWYEFTWTGAPNDDAFCKNRVFSIQAPPKSFKIIAPWSPGIAGSKSVTEKFSEAFKAHCSNLGGRNWLFAAKIAYGFRIDQHNRVLTINAIKGLLANSTDFIDLNGDSVKLGARKTLFKNLTASNRGSGSMDELNFEMYNSLGHTGAAGKLLAAYKITPSVLYSDLLLINDVCQTVIRYIATLPSKPDAIKFINDNTTPLALANLKAYAAGEPSIDNDLHNSLGFEKNPWVMAYVGVKAQTTPRQVFAPFGAVTLKARAFAKPFGGRIGPWVNSQWPSGSERSQGGTLLDPLLPDRDLSHVEFSEKPNSRPNYSRFPGDTLGLRSQLALSALKGFYTDASVHIKDYSEVGDDFFTGGPNDVLAYNGVETSVRPFEIAALAPDLFDISYYSIMPHFSTTTLPKLNVLQQNGQLPGDLPLRGDLGSRGGNKDTVYNVDQQVRFALGKIMDGVYYYVKDEAHLLTSWAPNNFNDYSFPDQYFGKCSKYDHDYKEHNTPNGCIKGGRTGYSVKFVSRDYLLRELMLGGPGQSGGILNPPPDGF